MQNQLLSRCVVTRTTTVVVTSSVVVSSRKITLAHGALGIVLRLPDGERALYATPCGGRGAVRHLRRCECYRCRLFRYSLCDVDWDRRHMQHSFGLNNGSTLSSIIFFHYCRLSNCCQFRYFFDKKCAISATMVLTFTKIYYYRGILLILGRFNINGFKLFFFFQCHGHILRLREDLKCAFWLSFWILLTTIALSQCAPIS